MHNWFITTDKNISLDYSFQFDGGNYVLFSDDVPQQIEYDGSKFKFFVFGFALPTLESTIEVGDKSAILIRSIEKYGVDFMKYIKGNFIIVLFQKENFILFNDQMGIRKYFQAEKNNKIFFSNSFQHIQKFLSPTFSVVNFAQNALFNHYIEGSTIYKEISFSKRASRVQFYKGQLLKEHYFDLTDFYYQEKRKIPSDSFSQKFLDIMKQYIQLPQVKGTALTLTGGFDSRILLAALLHHKTKPIVFNYGNPKSFDVVIAKEISKQYDLTFFNNSLDHIDKDWFDTMSKKIAVLGNGITQAHRAHRLDTFERLKNNYSVDTVYGGYMGGEGILGIYYDDLITSEFVRRKWKKEGHIDDLVSKILRKKFIRINKIEQEELVHKVSEMPFWSKDHNLNHFLFSYYVKGEIHHIQDMNLSNDYFDYNIPFFLDIDYLKLLFSSKYSFLEKDMETDNPFKRIDYHRIYCEMLNYMYKDLGNIPLSKSGYYTPNEFLRNKYFTFLKRTYRHKFSKTHYPTNFKLDSWMTEYVKSKYKDFSNPLLLEHINIEEIQESLLQDAFPSLEKYWQKYTDIIQADNILNL